MNLIYSQSLGQFRKDTAEIISSDGAWYAGGDMGQHPEAVNNPDYQNIRCQGSIPQGWYTLGPPYKERNSGPHCFLKPDTAALGCKWPLRASSSTASILIGMPAKLLISSDTGRNSSDGCPAATTLLEWEKIADLQKKDGSVCKWLHKMWKRIICYFIGCTFLSLAAIRIRWSGLACAVDEQLERKCS